MKNITGRHSVCGVIGDPIHHTLSPLIHNKLNEWMDVQSVYVPFHVTKESLKEAIQGAHALGIAGLNVTMPHKQEVMQYVVAIDEKAKQIGAINTLVYTEKGYKGYNTDIGGLGRAMMKNGIQWQGQEVAVIGCGGAGYATCLCVIEEAKHLHLYNRTEANARALKAHLEKYYRTPITVHTMEEEVAVELIIQTTGVGMGTLEGEMPPCSKALLAHGKAAVDLIYNPWETAFLGEAKRRGLQTMNGFDMLYYQAVEAYEKMHGLILSEEVCEHIKEKLMKELDV